MPPSAVSAALAVAASHGLPVRGARVVRDLTNVLVHLIPAPVVARVPLTLTRLRPPAWFQLEVELATFLAGAGAPVAPPAEDVDPGPHEQDGFLVSFWAYVEHDAERADPAAAGRSLREIHDTLRAWRGELPSCDRLDEVRTLLGLLERPRERLPRPDRVRPRLPPPARGSRNGEGARGLRPLRRRPRGAGDAHLALFPAAWTVVVVGRAPSEDGIAEARRRIGRALSAWRGSLAAPYERRA